MVMHSSSKSICLLIYQISKEKYVKVFSGEKKSIIFHWSYKLDRFFLIFYYERRKTLLNLYEENNWETFSKNIFHSTKSPFYIEVF